MEDNLCTVLIKGVHLIKSFADEFSIDLLIDDFGIDWLRDEFWIDWLREDMDLLSDEGLFWC